MLSRGNLASTVLGDTTIHSDLGFCEQYHLQLNIHKTVGLDSHAEQHDG